MSTPRLIKTNYDSSKVLIPRVYLFTGPSQVFGHSNYLSIVKFLDLSTPLMRKVDDGE